LKPNISSLFFNLFAGKNLPFLKSKPRDLLENKMRALIIATIGSLALAGAASAQSLPANSYVNAGVTQHHTDTTDTASLTGRFGADLTKYFGLEAEAGYGITTDTVSGVDLKQNGDLGIYATAKASVSDNMQLLGRVGYHHTWAQAEALGIKAKDDNGSAAIGVGAQYMLDAKNGIRGDYTYFTENDGVDNIALTYVRKF
jgi:outer membrane immunogenic protein